MGDFCKRKKEERLGSGPFLRDGRVRERSQMTSSFGGGKKIEFFNRDEEGKGWGVKKVHKKNDVICERSLTGN